MARGAFLVVLLPEQVMETGCACMQRAEQRRRPLQKHRPRRLLPAGPRLMRLPGPTQLQSASMAATKSSRSSHVSDLNCLVATSHDPVVATPHFPVILQAKHAVRPVIFKCCSFIWHFMCVHLDRSETYSGQPRLPAVHASPRA